MPQKVLELKSILLNLGFTFRTGKGSHPHLPYSIVLSGKDGADAQRYQEKDVRTALEDLASSEDEDLE